MKKILCIVLVTILGWPAFVAAALPRDGFFLKYYIEIGQSRKGMVVIRKNGEDYSSRYYRIDASDKLPFFAPEKSGSLRDGYVSTALKFEDQSFRFYYDPAESAPLFRKFSLGSGEGRALIMDEQAGRPKMSTENIPAVTLEGILLGLVDGTLPFDSEMIFFDTSRNSGFKIYFTRASGGGGNSSCPTSSVQCLRRNIDGQPDVVLFTIEMVDGKLPSRIVAASGRWQLRIGAITPDFTTMNLDLREKELEFGRNRVMQQLQLGAAPRIEVKGHRQGNIDYAFQARKELLSSYSDEQLLAGFVRDELFGSLPSKGMFGGPFFQKTSSGLVSVIDRKTLCRQMAKWDSTREYDRDCTEVITRQRKVISDRDLGEAAFQGQPCNLYLIEDGFMSSKLLCLQGEKEIDKMGLKEAVEIYLRSKEPQILSGLKGVEPVFNGASVSYEVREQIRPEQLRQEAVRFVATELRSNSPNLDPYLKESGDGYRFVIDNRSLDAYGNRLADAECRRLAGAMPGVRSQLSGGVCSVSGTFTMRLTGFYEELERQIYSENPDLRITGEGISKKNDRWSYRLLQGFEGVNNACMD